MQAVKLGCSVAAVERMREIGGNCTHRGTIPSKALRFAIYRTTKLLNTRLLDGDALAAARSFPNLRRSARSVIDQQVDMRQSFYERNNVQIYRGEGRLLGANTIEVCDEFGGTRSLNAGRSFWRLVHDRIVPTRSISSIRAFATATRSSTCPRHRARSAFSVRA